MSFVWANFENGDLTDEIRNILNQLGVNISKIINFYINIDISNLNFVSDATYEAQGFNKRCDIPIDDITSKDIPIVIFPTKDALSGDYGLVASKDGYVSVWRRDSVESLLSTIPFIGIIRQ